MAKQAEAIEKKTYRVLNWHPAESGIEEPCAINYLAGGKEKRAVSGDVVDDLPASAIGLPGQEDIRTFIVGVHIEEAGE
jgi:hypothetical protein